MALKKIQTQRAKNLALFISHAVKFRRKKFEILEFKSVFKNTKTTTAKFTIKSPKTATVKSPLKAQKNH